MPIHSTWCQMKKKRKGFTHPHFNFICTLLNLWAFKSTIAYPVCLIFVFLGSDFEWIFIDWKKKGPFSLVNATVIITLQHNTQLNTIVRTDPTSTQKWFRGQK